jgi:hypothetical protein
MPQLEGHLKYSLYKVKRKFQAGYNRLRTGCNITRRCYTCNA